MRLQSLPPTGIGAAYLSTDGLHHIVIDDYPLPAGVYNLQTTRLLIKLPVSFPQGAPDMFWVSPNLTFEAGGIPRQAETMESIGGESWRRFSWHPKNWNPGSCTLITFIEFINCRLGARQ
ncbi:MAG: hypothetical protein IPH75_16185 [bacterium]|nr:hypothetical protein [bacterium]